MLIVVMVGDHDVLLYRVLDTEVISGGDVYCSVVFCTLFGVSVMVRVTDDICY